MKRLMVFVDVIVLINILQLVFTSSALAYIDLGTGSYIFQMLMAGLLGSLFAMKATWRSLKSYVARWFSGNSPDQDEHD